jgi:hypothetical protein
VCWDSDRMDIVCGINVTERISALKDSVTVISAAGIV